MALQFLKLVRVAYEGLRKKVVVFTHLTADFEHLSMMKKTTSLNVCTGPECSYTFLHLTLQEYMAALYIAISGRDDGKLIQPRGSDVVMRFFAGICRHVKYQNHALYQELVQRLWMIGCCCSDHADNTNLVHCVYECPSIMHGVELDYSKYTCGAIVVTPREDFDWYVTGYCIGHFDIKWGLRIVNDLEEAETDLFLKGLGFSPIGRIRRLSLLEVSFSQVFSQLEKFCQLIDLKIVNIGIVDNDVNILRQLIAPGSELRCIQLSGCELNLGASQILFDQSSLEELTISNHTLMYFEPQLSHKNTNLKKLTISGELIEPLAAVLPNITSLTYLRINYPVPDSDLLVLIDLLQSHTTLEELELSIDDYDEYSYHDEDGCETLTNLPQLIEAADSCQKKLEIDVEYYNYLPDDMSTVMKTMIMKMMRAETRVMLIVMKTMMKKTSEEENEEEECDEDNDSSNKSEANSDEDNDDEDEEEENEYENDANNSDESEANSDEDNDDEDEEENKYDEDEDSSDESTTDSDEDND